MLKIDFLAYHKHVIPELAQEVFTQWQEMYTKQGKGPKELEKQMVIRAVVDTIPLTMVAFEDDVLVGSVTIKAQDFADRPELSPWIAAVFVKKEFRHKGYGSKLVLFAEEVAKKQFDKDTIYLYTGSAAELYKKLGYEIIDEVDRGDKILTVMQKKLQ